MTALSTGLITAGIAFLATAAVTPLVRAGARRLGYIAAPSADRWHKKPTALMGGIAIFVGFAIAVSVAFTLVYARDGGESIQGEALGVVGAALIMCIAGVLDDVLRFRPATKLVLQTIAAGVLMTAGVVYNVTPWIVANLLFTLFWFLGLTNALNLLDNMDGVAVGVGGIAAAFLGVTFLNAGQPALAASCFALAGACAGFLPYNFKPASVFMGDSGSLFIGAVLAGMGAALPEQGSGSLLAVLFVPALIVIIPIADTTLVTITRTLAGRSVAVGGRDHTAHRLVAMGLSERQVAGVMYAFAMAGGVLALVLQSLTIGYNVLVGGLFLVILFTMAAYLSKMHTYPSEAAPAASPRLTVLISNLLYKGRALEVVQDILLFGLSYYAAILLRWEGAPPAEQYRIFERTIGLVIATYIVAFALVGVYRGVWTKASVSDLRRVLIAVGIGTLATTAVFVFLFRTEEFSRSVVILTAVIACLLTIGARASFKVFENVRSEIAPRGRRTLIYGAGRAGELIVRELRGNADIDLAPVGFLDDDVRLINSYVHGLRVFAGNDLSVVLNRTRAKVVLLTTTLRPGRLEDIVAVCAARNAEVFTSQIVIHALFPAGKDADAGTDHAFSGHS